jgi:hypothetical protein
VRVLPLSSRAEVAQHPPHSLAADTDEVGAAVAAVPWGGLGRCREIQRQAQASSRRNRRSHTHPCLPPCQTTGEGDSGAIR